MILVNMSVSECPSIGLADAPISFVWSGGMARSLLTRSIRCETWARCCSFCSAMSFLRTWGLGLWSLITLSWVIWVAAGPFVGESMSISVNTEDESLLPRPWTCLASSYFSWSWTFLNFLKFVPWACLIFSVTPALRPAPAPPIPSLLGDSASPGPSVPSPCFLRLCSSRFFWT